jgi:rubrerythrin
METNKKLSDDLINLVQLDIDAILAYNQAIDGVEESDIRQTLASFRADHDRHVSDLSSVITRLGGTPPSMERDFKGFFIEGMTAIAGKIGTRSALMAMAGNETLTNARYQAAQSYEAPDDVRLILQRNLADEQRHIRYIQQTLAEKFGVAETEDATKTSAAGEAGMHL